MTLESGSKSFRIALVGIISTVGVLLGSTLKLNSNSHQLEFGETVNAQPYPDLMPAYKAAVNEIAQLRRNYLAQIEQVMNSKVPASVCDRGDVSQKVLTLCSQYKDEARGVVFRYERERGLSPVKFVEIGRWCSQTPKPQECP